MRGTNKTVRAITKWLFRPEWEAFFEEIYLDHVADACEPHGVDPDELSDTIGLGPFTMLFNCVVENAFVAPVEDREADGAATTVIDEYLKRRGWRESATGRRYLQALRDTPPGLYEVVGVDPGKTLTVRDVLARGEPVTVPEVSGSQNAAIWDHMVTRLLTVSGKPTFSGSLVPVSSTMVDRLIELQGKDSRELARTFVEATGSPEPGSEKVGAVIDRLFGQGLSQLACGLWLSETLDLLSAPPPTIGNSEGDELVFSDTRVPIDPDAEARIAALLDSGEGFERSSETDLCWDWIAPADSRTAMRVEHQGRLSSIDEPPVVYLRSDKVGTGLTVLGSHSMEDGTLRLQTNSVARTEEGIGLIADRLGELVGPPDTSSEDLEAVRARRRSGGERETDCPDLSPELRTAILRDQMEAHYRSCLDAPVGMLDGETPRQAAAHEARRENVVSWLKTVENRSMRQARAQQIEDYDFAWMWEELGVADMRR